MAEERRLAALELGAASGPVVLGRFDGKRVSLAMAHDRPIHNIEANGGAMVIGIVYLVKR